LKELTRSYLAISKDLIRVMNRLKALYRSRGIACGGTLVYAPRQRSEWLGRITEAGGRRRAEHFYQELDALQALRQEVRRDLLAESGKHSATELLCQIPCIGPIRAAQLIALIQTPHRFRTKRQLWTYSGLGLETHASAQYRYVEGQLQRSRNRSNSVDLIRTTTTISKIFLRVRQQRPASPLDHSAISTRFCSSRAEGQPWHV
jgi:transposase